jgi:hypothetical protein
LLSIIVYGQENENKRFELSVNYGVAGSFFVNYEQPIEEVPLGFVSFYNKKFIGTIGGGEFVYNTKNGKSSIGLSYDRQIHVGKKNDQRVINNTLISVVDFKLRHLNEIFSVFYRRKITDKFNAFAGFYLLFPHQQELSYFNNVVLEERNSENSNLTEGGILIGAEYFFYSSGNFELGIQSKLFHTTSTGEFETISFTPKLRYSF